MGLNKSTGNMYDFISHTWNTVKGRCYHDCLYCYMKRWGVQREIRFDDKELKTDLGKGNFIFVGSSNDLFAESISENWILKTLKHCEIHDNKYLFQTKNPKRFIDYLHNCVITDKSILCTTIESNREYKNIQGNCPSIIDRAESMQTISRIINTYVTIEPIMDFDLIPMVDIIRICNPVQVNIGADSGNHNLPEPGKEKLLLLIVELEKFTKVKLKKNLHRLLK